LIYSEDLDLNVIIYSYYDAPDSYYRLITNGFNEYAKEKGLGIHVDLKVLTTDTSTNVVEDYGNTIDSLLVKKPPKI